jgi:hypothetical protein
MARRSDPGRYWLTDFRCAAFASRGHQCRRYGDTTREPRAADYVFADCVRCRAHATQPGPVLAAEEPRA